MTVAKQSMYLLCALGCLYTSSCLVSAQAETKKARMDATDISQGRVVSGDKTTNRGRERRRARKSGDIVCTSYGWCRPMPCPRGKKSDGTCW